jgi:hypothetical protein
VRKSEKLVAEYDMRPAFVGQNLYLASGPSHEVLAGLMPSGLYQVELLDKNRLRNPFSAPSGHSANMPMLQIP